MDLDCDQFGIGGSHSLSECQKPQAPSDPKGLLVCALKALGATDDEIEEFSGLDRAEVIHYMGQEWFQYTIVKFVGFSGENKQKAIIGPEAAQALLTLSTLMRTAKSETVRMHAAKEFLLRYFGPVKVGAADLHDDVPKTAEEEAHAIEEEIQKLSA